MDRSLELLDAAGGVGAGGGGGDGGDEEHTVERAEELPRHRLIWREDRCGHSGGRRLLGADEAALEGDPRMAPRARRLAEAARESAAAPGGGRGRGDGYAGRRAVWGRRRLATAAAAAGDHGDEGRVWNSGLGIFVCLGG